MKHLLIDLTQTQAADLNKIHEQDCCVWLFVPAGCDSLRLDLAESLCRFGSRVQFIRMAQKSRNSLGFYFSFYIGRISLEDPNAQIIILSQDSGFDPLLQHIGQSGLADHTLRLDQIGGKAANILHKSEEQPSESAPPAATAESDLLDQKLTELCLKKSVSQLAETAQRPDSENGLAKFLKKILADDIKRLSKEKRKNLLNDIHSRLFELDLVQESSEGTLDYLVSPQDIEPRIIRAVRLLKPRNKSALFSLIRSHAEPLLQQSWSEQIAYDICRRLADGGLLNLHGQRVLYPISHEEDKQPTAPAAVLHTQAAVSDGLSPTAEKALATLRKIRRNKPRQSEKLVNSLVQWLRSDEAQARAVIGELEAAGHIRTGQDGQIEYAL